MAKPIVSMRRPPPPVGADAADRFVVHGGAAPATTAQASLKHVKAMVERKDGRELRRMTVYLPPDLARRIGIYAAHGEQDVSAAIADICSRFLATWKA